MEKFRIAIPSPNIFIHHLAGVPAAILDDKGNKVDANRAFVALAGEDRAAGFRELLPEEESMERLCARCVESPEDNGTAEVKIRLSGGELTTARAWMAGIETGKRKLYALLLYETAQEEEAGLLRQFSGSFVKDVNLGVMLIDHQFRLVDISDMACSILGIERDKSLYRPLEEVFQSVPKEHQLVQRNVLDGVVVRNHAISWTNNRERYELLMDTNLFRDPQGNVIGAYVIFKDVTNLRSLEQQVQRSDRLAMIGQIAAGTAHEIRNPLTSIKGFLQVLNRTFSQNGMEKEQGYTDLMLAEIDRINELVNEFLLLSKPKDVTFDRVDVSSVIRDILPIINNQAVLHNVTIKYQSVYQIPKVVADRELLKQVFINLCKNGIEAMVEGGTLTIIERVDYREKKVLVEIQDAGPGIPAFLIDKIFDPFFTTKDNGTGLGLSVCQRIIHDIGGNIRVSSKGYGTTFTVSLPFSSN
jgi:signal transduction histidine kinase